MTTHALQKSALPPVGDYRLPHDPNLEISHREEFGLKALHPPDARSAWLTFTIGHQCIS
ncbi:MAG TPA: hypothetical protein PLX89_20630 [Verrucomicrobiota bacterium]|nr:hypothetical protein [Verrucomicrobiota bacterium]